MINLKRKKKTLDDVIRINLKKFEEFDRKLINSLYESAMKCHGMV